MPGHTDHPGTPTQLFTAAILRSVQLIYTVTSWESIGLYEFVAKEPERSLSIVAASAIMSYAVFLMWAGYIAWMQTKSLVVVLLIQSSVIVVGDQLIHLAVLNGETMGLIFGALLLGLFLKEWVQTTNAVQPEGTLRAIGIGASIAGMVFAKVTFAPIILLLFGVQGWARRLYAAIGFLGSCVVLAIPSYGSLPNIMGWFEKIIRHDGIYGGGGEQFIDLETVPERTMRLLDAYPAPALIATIACLWVAFKLTAGRRDRYTQELSDPHLRFVVCGVIALVAQYIMVVKHFKVHYYVPSLVIAGMIGCTIVDHAYQQKQRAGRYFKSDRIFIALYCVIVIQAGYTILLKEPALVSASQRQATLQAEISNFKDAVPKALWVGAYGAQNQNFAQAFALGYVDRSVARMYQKAANETFISFNRFSEKFWTVSGWKTASYIEGLVEQGTFVIAHLPQGLDRSSTELELVPLSEFSDGSTAYRVVVR